MGRLEILALSAADGQLEGKAHVPSDSKRIRLRSLGIPLLNLAKLELISSSLSQPLRPEFLPIT